MDLLGAEPETDPELAGENTSNLIQDGLKTPPEELDEVSEEEEVWNTWNTETTTSDRKKRMDAWIADPVC